VNRCR